MNIVELWSTCPLSLPLPLAVVAQAVILHIYYYVEVWKGLLIDSVGGEEGVAMAGTLHLPGTRRIMAVATQRRQAATGSSEPTLEPHKHGKLWAPLCLCFTFRCFLCQCWLRASPAPSGGHHENTELDTETELQPSHLLQVISPHQV